MFKAHLKFNLSSYLRSTLTSFIETFHCQTCDETENKQIIYIQRSSLLFPFSCPRLSPARWSTLVTLAYSKLSTLLEVITVDAAHHETLLPQRDTLVPPWQIIMKGLWDEGIPGPGLPDQPAAKTRSRKFVLEQTLCLVLVRRTQVFYSYVLSQRLY